MNKNTILCGAIAATVAIATSCSAPQKGSEKELYSFDESMMDKSVKPSEDFYRFANGTWLKNKVLPETEK